MKTTNKKEMAKKMNPFKGGPNPIKQVGLKGKERDESVAMKASKIVKKPAMFRLNGKMVDYATLKKHHNL